MGKFQTAVLKRQSEDMKSAFQTSIAYLFFFFHVNWKYTDILQIYMQEEMLPRSIQF